MTLQRNNPSLTFYHLTSDTQLQTQQQKGQYWTDKEIFSLKDIVKRVLCRIVSYFHMNNLKPQKLHF